MPTFVRALFLTFDVGTIGKRVLVIIIFLICLGAASRQYCRYTKSPKVITLLKEIWESPRAEENLTSVGFESTNSGLDLPMLYRLSYEASTEACRGNLDSESR